MTGWLLIALGAAHLGYTYAAYPALLALLPRRAVRGAELPPAGLVSIVIAARRPGLAVADKVRDLLATTALDCEIIVVLDGPDPEAAAALGAIGDSRVRLLVAPQRQGKAAALNRGVAAARGEVLVFTDVRQRIAAGAVEHLVEGLRSPDVGAISGSVRAETSSRQTALFDYYWRMEYRLRAAEAGWDSAVGVSGALYALRRELWRPLPDGLLLDDVWVPMIVVRAGGRVGLDLRATAVDVGHGADGTEFERKVRTLTGNYQLVAWMPSVLDPRKNRIWWQFVSHKLLRLATPLATACLVVGGLLLAGPLAPWVGGALLLVLLAAWLSPRARLEVPGVPLLRAIRSGVVLHGALGVALVNAVRRRWDVWGNPPRPRLGEGEASRV